MHGIEQVIAVLFFGSVPVEFIRLVEIVIHRRDELHRIGFAQVALEFLHREADARFRLAREAKIVVILHPHRFAHGIVKERLHARKGFGILGLLESFEGFMVGDQPVCTPFLRLFLPEIDVTGMELPAVDVEPQRDRPSAASERQAPVRPQLFGHPSDECPQKIGPQPVAVGREVEIHRAGNGSDVRQSSRDDLLNVLGDLELRILAFVRIGQTLQQPGRLLRHAVPEIVDTLPQRFRETRKGHLKTAQTHEFE